MESIAVNLATFFEIDRDDCVQDARRVAARWILDLGATGGLDFFMC